MGRSASNVENHWINPSLDSRIGSLNMVQLKVEFLSFFQCSYNNLDIKFPIRHQRMPKDEKKVSFLYRGTVQVEHASLDALSTYHKLFRLIWFAQKNMSGTGPVSWQQQIIIICMLSMPYYEFSATIGAQAIGWMLFIQLLFNRTIRWANYIHFFPQLFSQVCCAPLEPNVVCPNVVR